MNRSMLTFLVLALLAAPGATAAEAQFADEPITVPPGGSASLDVTVVADCADIVAGGGALSVPVATSGLPDWLGASTTTAEFAATDCLSGQTSASKAVALTFTPTDEAVGLSPFAFQIVAGEATFEHKKPIQVGYADGHSITIDRDFPYTLTDADDGTITWNITIDVAANSQTMVMFQNLQTSAGKLSGVNHQIFDVEEDDTSRTLTATFEAPTFEWDEVTISFWNYSHCLKGTDCPPTNSQNVTWVITNGATGTSSRGSGEGEDSPGLAPIGLSLALVAAALVARRRA